MCDSLPLNNYDVFKYLNNSTVTVKFSRYIDNIFAVNNRDILIKSRL